MFQVARRGVPFGIRLEGGSTIHLLASRKRVLSLPLLGWIFRLQLFGFPSSVLFTSK